MVFKRAIWWCDANVDRWHRQNNITRIVRELYPVSNRKMHQARRPKIAASHAQVKPEYLEMEVKMCFKSEQDK